MLPTILTWLILLGALAPLFFYLAAIRAATAFRRRQRQHASVPSAAPLSVSVLIPVRGVEEGAHENIGSLLRQQHPQFEVLFCASEESDPAVPILRGVMAEHPEVHVRLLIGAPAAGPHDKVNKLCRLAAEARHEILLACDSDVRVAPNFLSDVTSSFADARVGAVTCMYRGVTPRQLAAEMEALGSATDFFAGVLVAEQLEGVKFALGQAMATRRHILREIGGFEGLADCYADDYQFGARIARAGYDVVISPHVVATVYPRVSWKEFFAHQVRWRLSVRAARPWGYVGLLFTQGLAWSFAAAAVCLAQPAAIALPLSAWIATAYIVVYLVLRLGVAWTVGVGVLEDTVAREVVRRRPWLVLLRDALGFVTWLAGFFTRSFNWRGAEFRLRRGKLIAVHPKS